MKKREDIESGFGREVFNPIIGCLTSSTNQFLSASGNEGIAFTEEITRDFLSRLYTHSTGP
jgi:hypothetical protein